MLKRILGAVLALGAGAIAQAAVVTTLDIHDISDGGTQAPSNVVMVDISVNVGSGETLEGQWITGGIAASTANGATFRYRGGSPTGVAQRLRNPLNSTGPTVIATCVSDPQSRAPANETIRFQFSGGDIAGGYIPAAGGVVGTASVLNVGWYKTPVDPADPEYVGAYSGAVARVAINLPAPYTAADVVLTVGTATAPAGNILMMKSTDPEGLGRPGTVNASQGFPGIAGGDWNLSVTPEPASLALLALGAIAAFRRR